MQCTSLYSFQRVSKAQAVAQDERAAFIRNGRRTRRRVPSSMKPSRATLKAKHEPGQVPGFYCQGRRWCRRPGRAPGALIVLATRPALSFPAARLGADGRRANWTPARPTCRQSSPPSCAHRLRRMARRAGVAAARRTPSAHLRAQLALHPAASPVAPYKARCARRLGPQPCTVWAGRPDCPCFVAFTACLWHASSGCPLRGATSGAPSRSAPGQPLLTCATVVASVVSDASTFSPSARNFPLRGSRKRGCPGPAVPGAGRHCAPQRRPGAGAPYFGWGQNSPSAPPHSAVGLVASARRRGAPLPLPTLRQQAGWAWPPSRRRLLRRLRRCALRFAPRQAGLSPAARSCRLSLGEPFVAGPAAGGAYGFPKLRLFENRVNLNISMLEIFKCLSQPSLISLSAAFVF
jgi:hypothetical protein